MLSLIIVCSRAMLECQKVAGLALCNSQHEGRCVVAVQKQRGIGISIRVSVVSSKTTDWAKVMMDGE